MARPAKTTDIDLTTALKMHLTALQIKGYSEFTVRNRKVHIGFFVRWCDAHSVRLTRNINGSVLKKYMQHVFEYRKRDGQPLSTSSRFARLVPLRVWIRWMKRERIISIDLSDRIELPRLGRHLPHVILSQMDVARILKQPNARTPFGLRNRAILELLYSSGLRRLEVARLQVADLQLDRGLVLVRSGKGNRDRYVPVGARASRWVMRYLRRARPHAASDVDEPALFLSREGRAINRDHLTAIVRQCVTQSGIGKAGACHLFRHTLATLMHENGADIRFVQQMLGHADIRTTQIYTQVAIRKLQEVHRATHPAW
jgi:integrase/recombinase XerD